MIDQIGALREIFQAVGVVAWGTLDTSSATVPADSTRTEGDDQFKDMFLMPLNGTYQGVCKRITDYTGVGGIFQIDVADPFPGVTGLVPYFVINRYVPPILGGNTALSLFSTALVTPDRHGDIVHKLEWLISNASSDIAALPYLVDLWQDPAGIDFTVWNVVVGAGGTVARSVATEPYQEILLGGAAAGDTARLYTVWEWQLGPDTWGIDTVQKKLVMEWESIIDNVADVDNATFFMGFGALALTTRASNDIAGVALVGDAYNFITDDGGAETVTVLPSAPATNARHKFKLVAYAGTIELWCDETLEVTHTTAAGENLPDVNAHGQFYCTQEAGGGGTGVLHVGPVGIRPEGID